MQSVVTAIPSQRGPSSFSQADQQVEFVREIDLNARSKKVFLSITPGMSDTAAMAGHWGRSLTVRDEPWLRFNDDF